MEYKGFFKKVTGNEGERCHYATRLDTYGKGCIHNCSYCYARSLLDFRGLWNPAEPAVADLTKIVKTVNKNLKAGDVVRLGGMTDCFQGCESKYRITRDTIRLLNKKGVHYLIVTKSPMVASYAPIMDKRLAHIQVSITSTDAEISRRIEPGAAYPEKRIEAVESLYSQGFDVAVRLSPFIPEIVDTERIRAIDCDKILVEFLRINTFIRKWMQGFDFSEYTHKAGGYCHLPLEAKKRYIDKLAGGGGDY